MLSWRNVKFETVRDVISSVLKATSLSNFFLARQNHFKQVCFLSLATYLQSTRRKMV